VCTNIQEEYAATTFRAEIHQCQCKRASISDVYKVLTSARALPIAHYVFWSFPQVLRQTAGQSFKQAQILSTSSYIVNLFLFYTA